MKLKTLAALALASVLSLMGAAEAATIVLGSGSDSAFYVLESPNIGTRTYEIRFTHNEADPLDGWDLLQVVDSYESDLSVQAFNFGSEEAPNWFVNAITWMGITETSNSDEPYVPSWTQWVSGGEAGWPSASPIASGTWTSGSGLSSPFRVIEPGSWEALKFSDFTTVPTVTPVPEPSALMLAFCGMAFFIRRRR
ncbi:hypothetical protein OJ996_00085 [Luteolibacter sp. GHJ8]|uniref:Ice-binding protein C-terminal domain-containing protein n=1 Tax=Luteolibacter rhizosphaerae TaxID=2989719 RepID=A0ABT3FWI9_9BACT|nr:PEP-CTERM sorting domain-containing protein [Luteolibacter rhizosphaerae]MCW1911950.1 hypothetical protein [Luteolibacter rhizosphaerae]